MGVAIGIRARACIPKEHAGSQRVFALDFLALQPVTP
jgi:hypothetical protein